MRVRKTLIELRAERESLFPVVKAKLLAIRSAKKGVRSNFTPKLAGTRKCRGCGKKTDNMFNCSKCLSKVETTWIL